MASTSLGIEDVLFAKTDVRLYAPDMRFSLVLLASLVAFSAMAGVPDDADLRVGPSAPWKGKTATRCHEVWPVIARVSRRHDMDPGVIVGIIRHESRFSVRAKNPRSSATGLMQILKSTGRRLKCGDRMDAEQNIDCGVRLLKRWLKVYDGDLLLALSGYGLGYKAPNTARRNHTFPRNLRFIERVLRARAVFLRHGCGEASESRS